MSIEQMRGVVSSQYPSTGWRNKVALMSDSQVFAIYTKLKLSGKV